MRHDPPRLRFGLLLFAGLASACVDMLDPLTLPFDEDAGGTGDAGLDAGDAGAALALCEAGAEQVLACGNCGTMTFACDDGAWTEGPCLGEGVCTWGSQQACGTSGTEVQTCLPSCTWGSCSDGLAP